MDNLKQDSSSGHNALPTLSDVTFSIDSEDQIIDPTKRFAFTVGFTPSRPCLGLSIRIYFVAVDEVAWGRVRTKRRHLCGEIRRGRIELDFRLSDVPIPQGDYTVQLEIKNFRTLLYRADVQTVSFASGIDPGPLKPADRGTFQHRDFEYNVDITPEPDPNVPAPTRTPWERKGKPVWAYLKYKRNIHGGYQKRPLGVHIHIPKCGGTTFRREILPVWYPDQNGRAMVRDVFISNYVERDELFCAPPSLIDRLLLITGHDSYGAVPDPDKGILPICFFRDPFDRSSSLWNHHVKGETGFGLALQKLYINEADFLLRSDLMQDYWRSFLSFEEMLIFIGKPRSRQPGRELRDTDPDYYTWLEQTARQRIADLPFVLLTEKFDESLVYMHLAHGFPLVPYKRQRVNRSQDEIDAMDASKAELQAACPEVTAFHKAIESRFDEQIKDMPLFEERLDHYRWLNEKQIPVNSWRARIKRKTGM